MLSDKLELNSVRALGRLELTSWEHIPDWAEIQPALGKPGKAWPAYGGRRGAVSTGGHSSFWGWSQESLEGWSIQTGYRRKNGGVARPSWTLNGGCCCFWLVVFFLGGTAWSRDLMFKSVKWAESVFQRPGAFPSFKATLGKQEGFFLLSCNSHGLVEGSIGCLGEFLWGGGRQWPAAGS